MNNYYNIKIDFRTWLALIVISIAITSCESSEKLMYSFNPGKLTEHEKNLSEFADDIIYIPLDNSIPLDLIYGFKFSDDKIYLSVKNNGLLVYTSHGKFIRKIGNTGRGPGDYFHFTNFVVDQKSGKVYINDTKNVIKVFSKDGRFVRNITIDETLGNLEEIGFLDSWLFASFSMQFSEAKYNWIIIDTLGNLVKSQKRSLPLFWSNWNPQSGTYYLDDRLYYWNSYNDTVFSISADLNIGVSFLFAQGDHRLPLSTLDPSTVTKYMLVRSVFESPKLLFVRCDYNKNRINTIIDKTSNEHCFVSIRDDVKGWIVNDIDAGISFGPINYYCENGNDYLAGIIYPIELKAHVYSDEFLKSNPLYPEKKNALEKLANNLKETDNPVLMIVKLKKTPFNHKN